MTLQLKAKRSALTAGQNEGEGFAQPAKRMWSAVLLGDTGTPGMLRPPVGLRPLTTPSVGPALRCASLLWALPARLAFPQIKCFIEEVPDETMVTGKYRAQRLNPDGTFADEDKGVGINVKVTDPTGDVVMDKDYEGSGRFTFNTHEPGEHTICLHTNSSRWFSGTAVVSPATRSPLPLTSVTVTHAFLPELVN